MATLEIIYNFVFHINLSQMSGNRIGAFCSVWEMSESYDPFVFFNTIQKILYLAPLHGAVYFPSPCHGSVIFFVTVL